MDFSFILNWLGLEFGEPRTWFQAGAVAIIVPSVWLINIYISKSVESRLDEHSRKLKRISFKAMQRLSAPLIALALFIIAKLILQHQQLPVDILLIAIPLSISLAIIRLSVYLLRKAFPVTPLLKTWENIFVIVVWTMLALHLIGWLPELLTAMDDMAITLGSTKISLLTTIKTILSVAFFIVLALWLSAMIEKRLKRSKDISNYLQIGITKTLRVILLIVAFIIALNVIGIDLTTLTVLGGALGVGIGFGLQRIASNFISGFILLFDRSIRPNDVITINDSFGWVKELRARYVVIQDRDGVETLIPNENLVTSQVINWSYTDKSVRLKIPVQISYHDDPELAIKLMIEAANECERVLKDPPAVCRLLGFGDSGINMEARCWINDPQNGVNNVRSEVNLGIWRKFKQNGITIPFPQRDVHLSRPLPTEDER
jgi:small-conductance mechanosensitive channel